MCVCVCVCMCVCVCLGVGGVCVMSKVASIKVINGCDPLKLHFDPLRFQQPSLHAMSD